MHAVWCKYPNEAAPGDAPRRHPLVHQWVQGRIDAVNRELASSESIKHFCIADEPLTMEGGFLTPSLKVKRNQVYERYRVLLEALYEV